MVKQLELLGPNLKTRVEVAEGVVEVQVHPPVKNGGPANASSRGWEIEKHIFDLIERLSIRITPAPAILSGLEKVSESER